MVVAVPPFLFKAGSSFRGFLKFGVPFWGISGVYRDIKGLGIRFPKVGGALLGVPMKRISVLVGLCCVPPFWEATNCRFRFGPLRHYAAEKEMTAVFQTMQDGGV